MQNRVPGKALGCNFSRYIRDGSRNEKRKDPGREKRAAESEGKKKPVANFRPSRTTIVPDGGTLDYSQGIFQLSKSLRRFLFLKRRIRKYDSSRLRDSLRKAADNSIRFFGNQHNFIYRPLVLDKLASIIFFYVLTRNSNFFFTSISNQYATGIAIEEFI